MSTEVKTVPANDVPSADVVDEKAVVSTGDVSVPDDPEAEDPSIVFKPIVQLPVVEVKTMEENEDELFKCRAKLYRFENGDDGPEWKERGLGDVKILRNRSTEVVRILMRREKTFKLCANHYITPSMKLEKYQQSEKHFMWTTLCDFSDGQAKRETLCIKFGSEEKASQFKKTFEDAQQTLQGMVDVLNRLSLTSQTSSDTASESSEEEDFVTVEASKEDEVTEEEVKSDQESKTDGEEAKEEESKK